MNAIAAVETNVSGLVFGFVYERFRSGRTQKGQYLALLEEIITASRNWLTGAGAIGKR